jgi:hypothetical protein
MLSLRCCLLTIGRFSTFTFSLFSLTACNFNPSEIFAGLDPAPAATITSLQAKPDGESVVVEGKVGTIAPLVGQVAFEVQDKTGVVWVLSDSRAPAPNSQVKVHGVLRTMQGERYLDQK